MIDFTPLLRGAFVRRTRRTDSWRDFSDSIQTGVLRSLLSRAASTEYGRSFGFGACAASGYIYRDFSGNVPVVEYEDIRAFVMRMVRGERNVLWPGKCRDFAQSSGTSGGRSKFIPITPDSLSRNHYAGGKDVVAHYLKSVPASRLFSGKSFILGGSFANTLGEELPGVHVGDLSATLIRKINPFANLVRVPDKKTALMPDWETKLPALVRAASHEYVTNISGVPSWFLTVIRKICEARGVERISEVWPGLEVFFHGGISFEPYRHEYESLTDAGKMHFMETYNASEGFFAVQDDLSEHSMLLLIDNDIFYEFLPEGVADAVPLPIWEVEPGKVYELVISSSNGLWRYRIGDTVKITQTNPVKITIAGRTKSFINAFGEELMEDNAERAVASACRKTNASIANYTAAPQYAEGGKKGRHQWFVEWKTAPADVTEFSMILDDELRRLNSDYDAKRSHSIFLDPPEVVSVAPGTFERWLSSAGNHKLGGQRKVPRLSNDRKIAESLLLLNKI